jgi:hypothetical protein
MSYIDADRIIVIKGISITSIIYLCQISDNRLTGSVPENLNYSLVYADRVQYEMRSSPTMWGKFTKEEGKQWEVELLSGFLKDIVANGCRTERFENTFESAWGVVGRITQRNSGTPFAIQVEMNDRVPFHKTSTAAHATKSTQEVPKGLRWKFRRFFSWWVAGYFINV